MRGSKSIEGISVRFLNDKADMVSGKLRVLLSSDIDRGIFPDKLKVANISQIFKSEDSIYGPGGVLNMISKLLEKLMNKHYVGYIEQFYFEQYLYVGMGKDTQLNKHHLL